MYRNMYGNRLSSPDNEALKLNRRQNILNNISKALTPYTVLLN